MVAKIATGEIEDERELSSAAAELGRKGGKARAAKMAPERRAEIARKAATKRWKDAKLVDKPR
jgi:general stress protein YciG